MSDEGSVHGLSVEYDAPGDTQQDPNRRDDNSRDREHPFQTYLWSDEIQEMDVKSGSLRGGITNLAMRESTEVDLSGLYECV